MVQSQKQFGCMVGRSPRSSGISSHQPAADDSRTGCLASGLDLTDADDREILRERVTHAT
jgi:hypothetical protein